jgi:hypothetical protein
MYIVIPQPAYNANAMSFSYVTPSAPLFFKTKAEVLNYIRSNNGKYRVFEGVELDVSVDVNLRQKDEDINNPGWQ